MLYGWIDSCEIIGGGNRRFFEKGDDWGRRHCVSDELRKISMVELGVVDKKSWYIVSFLCFLLLRLFIFCVISILCNSNRFEITILFLFISHSIDEFIIRLSIFFISFRKSTYELLVHLVSFESSTRKFNFGSNLKRDVSLSFDR